MAQFGPIQNLKKFNFYRDFWADNLKNQQWNTAKIS